MKKILFVLIIISLFLPVSALAAPRENVQGYFRYTPTECEKVWVANDNLISRGCKDIGDWDIGIGDFVGTSTEVYDLVLHGWQGGFDYEDGWYKGTVTFDGTVLGGAPGTMKIMFVGKSPGDIYVWSGTWVILSGTGGLANIQGQGIFRSAMFPLDGGVAVYYEGEIKFAGD